MGQSDSRGFMIAFCTVFVFLLLLIVVIITIFTATHIRMLCCRTKKAPELQEAAQGMQRAANRANTIVCCSPNATVKPDGSEDGFTMELAENLVDSLEVAIKFCQGNTVIARVLKEKNILISSSAGISSRHTAGTQDVEMLKIEQAEVLN